ncbi:MAG TPA: DNA recombination protein RmuC, partial [Puia sp.]
MTIELVFLVIILFVCIAAVFFAYKASISKNENQLSGIDYKLESFSKDVARIESSVKDEIINNRKETLQEFKSSREELANSLRSFGDLISNSMKTIGDVQKD